VKKEKSIHFAKQKDALIHYKAKTGKPNEVR
jgi:hypothetical protein